MKTSTAIQNKPIIPSLFQIAARVEDFAPAIISKSSQPPQTPFADLMLHPEKLEAALRAARNENDAFDATRKFSRSPTMGATRSATSKNFAQPPPENLPAASRLMIFRPSGKV